MVKISASILASDFLHLEEEVKNMEKAGVDYIHYDIMDGHFVPNLSFGFKFISSVNQITNLKSDTHLMITNPQNYIKEYINSGCDILTFHYETTNFHIRMSNEIKKHNCKSGISINPSTPIQILRDILPFIDVVLLMTVDPGFYGQKFIDTSYRKIEELKTLIIKDKANTLIEVDGGICLSNYKKLINCGADILVIGNDLFKQTDYKKYIKEIKSYEK